MAKILIVDDRAVERELLTTLLGYVGHESLEASDGAEALKMVASERPDLVIADLLMPTMDGFELVRRLRANPATAHTPVVFYTATYLQYEARALAESCGVRHILLKPSDPEVILSTVSDALGTSVLPTAPMPEEFYQEHLQLVTSKLSQKLDVVIPRLAALIEIGQGLAREFDSEHMLKRFCQEARDILGAKYAAVGLLDDDGKTLRRFITSGLSAEEAARIGSPPTGRGLLGKLSVERGPFRVADIASDPRAVGFPPDHPPMKSFLGVPILSPTEHYGWLYFTDKLGVAEFSEEDESIGATLAAQIAVAYENALRREELLKLNAELEQRVAERTAELAALNRELEAFNYSISHDLRGPLRVIDGFSAVLLEDYGSKFDAEGTESLTRIRGATRQMNEMIEGLLNLSRTTRVELEQGEVDLSALARGIAEDLQRTQPERDVEFVIQDGLMATGDVRLLQVALANLLGNAWKFTSKTQHSRIEFGITIYNSHTVFYVRDNGAGFDPAYADKLFGVFKRLHSASEFEGTGIGLATVQRIMQRHGGEIWAEGAEGQGATFYFTL